jgi:hypothetical protein
VSTSDESGPGQQNPASAEVKYEFLDVRSVRGMEARTIAKKEQEGWELVSQGPGPMLRTNLRFRRPRPKTVGSWFLGKWEAFRALPATQQVKIAGAAAVVLVVLAVIGSFTGGDDSDPVAKKPVAAVETSKKPTAKATTEPTPEVTTPKPSPTSTPKPTPKPKPVADDADSDKTMTVKNSPALKELLSTDDDGVASKFAKKYLGRKIEFDGNIALSNLHEGRDTRFDFLVYAGDYPDAPGPAFQFNDKGYAEMNSPGPLLDRQNYHFTATVFEFDRNQSLFQLWPDSTDPR